jgi:hypothetical protein
MARMRLLVTLLVTEDRDVIPSGCPHGLRTGNFVS